jgi:hypothetical protein
LKAALYADVDGLKTRRSMAASLANALGRPQADSQFALYMARLGTASSSLVDRIRRLGGEDAPDPNALADLTAYVIGHVLANSVLRFPGPILSTEALCAYCATSLDEEPALAALFADAGYKGPFAGLEPHFWREGVDEALDLSREALPAGVEVGASLGEYNRAVVEARLGRPLTNHTCDRCGGVRGGFWCPFTRRPVCDRGDCSVPSSSWVPQGATLTRVERNFYDELAPLLGL